MWMNMLNMKKFRKINIILSVIIFGIICMIYYLMNYHLVTKVSIVNKSAIAINEVYVEAAGQKNILQKIPPYSEKVIFLKVRQDGSLLIKGVHGNKQFLCEGGYVTQNAHAQYLLRISEENEIFVQDESSAKSIAMPCDVKMALPK